MNIGIVFIIIGSALFLLAAVWIIKPATLKINVETKEYFSNENVIIQKPTFMIDMSGRPVGDVEASILADMILNFDDLINNRYRVPDKLHPKYDHITERKIEPADKITPKDSSEETKPINPDQVDPDKYVDVNSL